MIWIFCLCSGILPKNQAILREISSLCHQLPIMTSPNFNPEHLKVHTLTHHTPQGTHTHITPHKVHTLTHHTPQGTHTHTSHPTRYTHSHITPHKVHTLTHHTPQGTHTHTSHPTRYTHSHITPHKVHTLTHHTPQGTHSHRLLPLHDHTSPNLITFHSSFSTRTPH